MQTRFDPHERLFQIIRLVAGIDLDVARVRQGLLVGTDLTPAKHRILEALIAHGQLTVAESARTLSLKRQFVQRMIAEMITCGLVETEANPGHRRSFLCRPSARGRDLCDTLHAREMALITARLGDLNTTEVIVAQRTLNRLSACFSELAKAGAGLGPDEVAGVQGKNQ